MTEGQSPKHTPSPGLWVLLAGGILAGILMAILTVAWGRSNTPLPSKLGGDAPTSIPARAAVGQLAPSFSADTSDGKTLTLDELRGTPVALNFWATWCAPCRAEMPELQSAVTRYADQGLVVLGIDASESAEQVEAYMDDLALTFPSVIDPDGSIAILYGVYAFPTTIWLDAEGIVRIRHLGALTKDDIDRYMADLVGQ